MTQPLDPVADFYTRNPYPKWDRVEWAPDRRSSINTQAGRWDTAPIPDDARILVAGCGTRTAIEWARSMPKAQVYAIDLSPASIEVTHHLVKEFGQTNVRAEVRDLMTLGPDDGEFDVACATGVLHHLPDPVAGLKVVVDRLAPGGVLRMLAYSKRNRLWIGEFQDLVHLLSAEADNAGREAVGEALSRGLAAHGTRMADVVAAAQRIIDTKRVDWADAFVHPREERYDIDGLLGWLDESGAAFLGWTTPTDWDVKWRLPDGPVRARWDELSDVQRWKVADLVVAPMMNFWCGRADGVQEQVQVMRPLKVTPVDGADEVRISVFGAKRLTVHSFFGEVLHLLDGERSLRQAGEVAATAAGIGFADVQASTLGLVRSLIHPEGTLVIVPPSP